MGRELEEQVVGEVGLDKQVVGAGATGGGGGGGGGGAIGSKRGDKGGGARGEGK